MAQITRVTKYHIDWQICRLQVKEIKDPKSKIEKVLGFLQLNPTKQNLLRIKNWLRTTSWAYPKDVKVIFEDASNSIDDTHFEFRIEDDIFAFYKYNKDILSLLLKDLNKRKYNLQFNKTPKDHIIFVEKLTKYLNKDIL